MAAAGDTSDSEVLDHLRRGGSASVSQLVELTGVTATAVRQRLTRLMATGLVQRNSSAGARGRPSYQYRLTPVGIRSAGNNYDELAHVLWEEIRAVEQLEVRRGLLARIVGRLAKIYRGAVGGDTLDERMSSLAGMMSRRGVSFEVDRKGQLPVLTALSCPYPDLAEQDRSVCAMESMLFAEVLGEPLRLSACRLDGDHCCTFESSAAPR